MSKQKDFFEMVTAELVDDEEASKDNKPINTKGLLTKILQESDEVLGDFSKDLQNKESSITSKLDKIQSLQTVALAESIKSFSDETVCERRYLASQGLLRIASTLQGTITHKHKLELLESVDFTNPKISRGLNFFLELFIQTLSNSGIDKSKISKVLETLEVQLFDFETVLQEVFSKVPISEVSKISNPFIQNVEDHLEIEPVNVLKRKKTLKEKILAKRAKAKIKR